MMAIGNERGGGDADTAASTFKGMRHFLQKRIVREGERMDPAGTSPEARRELAERRSKVKAKKRPTGCAVCHCRRGSLVVVAIPAGARSRLHHCSGVAMRGCRDICELVRKIANSEGDAAIGAAVISPTDRRIRRREFKGGRERSEATRF